VLAGTIVLDYPKAAKAWATRGLTYNKQMNEVLKLEEEGKALIVAPIDIGNLKTLSQDHEAFDYLYKQGYEAADEIAEFIKD